MRRQAAARINEMFGLDITVDFRDDFKPEDTLLDWDDEQTDTEDEGKDGEDE